MTAKPDRSRLTATTVIVFTAAFAGLAAAQTSSPSLQKHVFHRASTGQTPRNVAGISPTDSRAARSTNTLSPDLFSLSTEVVAVSGNLSYTCDPSIDGTEAGTCTYLNTTIAGIYNATFANAKANIYIQFGITGLGESLQYLNLVPYNSGNSYLGMLTAESTSGDVIRTDALASLPATEPAIYSGGMINVTSALGTALDFAVTGITPSGASCNLGSSGCYNGIITITTPANLASETGNTQTLYFRQSGGTQPSNAYDFYTIVEHETDEVLGTSSCIGSGGSSLTDGCGGTNASAADLFRYSAPGTRVFENTTPGAYFSYDGGNTNVAVYNTLSNGDDYGDWVTNCAHVQDAKGCLGQSFDITNDGGVEIAVLDAVGYNVISAAATYVGADTTTQGAWTPSYGSDGYLIANDANLPPAYASVSLSGDTPYTWVKSTSDPRALQTASGAETRLASTYYAARSFTININITDGNTHQIALYLLDWDSTTRSETVSVLNATTNALLSTQTFSSFHNGVYGVWTIKGNVVMQVTRTGGANAVVSGIFFGTGMAPSGSATYSGLDTATQGAWTDAYGSNGEIIANDLNNPPAFATLSFSGDTPYTWVASTSDVRALQTASGASTRIASTFYAPSTFTMNLNLTDGNTHKISLYLLDWDTSARIETVTILDTNNGDVLSQETFSSFHGGDYAIWNINGHVLIQVKKTSGANAVVSGFFFD